MDPADRPIPLTPRTRGSRMYKEDGLKGGHVIMLGPGCEEAALAALRAYPQGLQIGGECACRACRMRCMWMWAIVTSFVSHQPYTPPA